MGGAVVWNISSVSSAFTSTDESHGIKSFRESLQSLFLRCVGGFPVIAGFVQFIVFFNDHMKLNVHSVCVWFKIRINVMHRYPK